MPTGSGEGFGVEVGRVWRAGAVHLPRVSDTLHEASVPMLASHAPITSRSGGLGKDPGGQLDELQRLIRKGVDDSKDTIDVCGQALIWAAEDYELTDEAARAAYQREKDRLD
ncbi:hypothetical protein FXB39_04705 [Nocardioides sp. BGMRC 2183]|nr:hypothetical protein FXB39_04705 [Nocardioides sp. BGMRC 2183]